MGFSLIGAALLVYYLQKNSQNYFGIVFLVLYSYDEYGFRASRRRGVLGQLRIGDISCIARDLELQVVFFIRRDVRLCITPFVLKKLGAIVILIRNKNVYRI